jgi:hypothetical protein
MIGQNPADLLLHEIRSVSPRYSISFPFRKANRDEPTKFSINVIWNDRMATMKAHFGTECGVESD